MERIDCLLCGSHDNSVLYEARDPDRITKEYYRAVKCTRCGFVYTNPRPTKEEMSNFYYGRYYGQLATYSGLFFELLNLFFVRRRAKRINRFKTDGRILDVGCGQGRLLRVLKEEGFEVFGIDPYGPEDKGLNILNIELGDGVFKDSFFDVVTLWHVLEHTHDPLKLLVIIRKILKDDGLLLLATPNIGSLEARLSKEMWFHLDLPRHLYHFNLPTIREILKKTGFKIIHINNFSLEYGPFGLMQTILNSCGGEFNLLFNLLKKGETNREDSSPGRRIYTLGLIVLFLLLFPLIVLVSYLFSLFKEEGTIELYCLKDEDYEEGAFG